MSPLVVDASVAFKWLIPGSSESDTPAAKRLLVEHYEGRHLLTIPTLLFYEVGNILACGRARLSERETEQALNDLLRVSLRTVAPDSQSMETTARLARRFGITFYDATYLALAEFLDCELVTADARLAGKARPGGRVRLLG